MSNEEELTLKAGLLEPQARDGALFVGSVTSQATFDEIVSKVMENQQIRQPFHPTQCSLHDLKHHLQATVHKLHLFQVCTRQGPPLILVMGWWSTEPLVEPSAGLPSTLAATSPSLRPDILQEGAQVLPVSSYLMTVTGATAPIRGRGDVSLQIGGLQTAHSMWVADIADQCILGLDFLESHGCRVDLGESMMHIGDQQIPLQRPVNLQPNVLPSTHFKGH